MVPRLLTLTRVLIALPITVFGVKQLLNPTFAPGIPQENEAVLITMPGWMPVHTFWAYVSGLVFVVSGIAILNKRYARRAANVLGLSVLLLIVLVYIPLTVSKATDIANGLNYLAIHFALAGAAFLLAEALPTDAVDESRSAAEANRPVLRRAG